MLACFLGQYWDCGVWSWGSGCWAVIPHRDAGPRVPEAGHWWQDCHLLVFSSSPAERQQQPSQAPVRGERLWVSGSPEWQWSPGHFPSRVDMNRFMGFCSFRFHCF